MNLFNSKSLIFYAVVIGSVLVLFKTITIYGETHLQASPMIQGSYLLTLTNNVPECRQSPSLRLNIQQSGIYLNASLFSAKAHEETQKGYSLKGLFQNQQLNLAGEVNDIIICNLAPPHTLKAQMQITDGGRLQGRITISTISQKLEFYATPEPAQAEPKNSNSY